MRRLPLPVIIIACLFGVAMAWLVISSLVPHQVSTYTPRTSPPISDTSPVSDTVTIDARDMDQWRFYAFARGALTPPDSSGWDLAFRRFHVITAGEAARLDTITFDELAAAPTAGYSPTTYDRDTVNRAITRWYHYSMFSHLLRPKREVYVIRSHAGRYVKLEFLSYYCPGPEPGCVTFRYGILR